MGPISTKPMTPMKWAHRLGPTGMMGALLVLTIAFSGCGKTEFQNLTESVALSSGPGYRVIPGKVDILFVTDNTPSFERPVQALQTTMGSMVGQLQQQNWDFHIAAMPLALGRPDALQYAQLSQILVDRYRNTAYLSDGSPNPSFDPDWAISPSLAIYDPDQLKVSFSTNYAYGSNEKTLESIRGALVNDANFRTRFVRPDAQLVIPILSNGNDWSGSDLSAWQTALTNAARKANYKSIQIIPIIATRSYFGSECWGANADAGTRYANLASLFAPSFAIDICQNLNIQTVAQLIQSQIIATKQAYVTSAIVLGVEPLVETIRIVKSTGEAIPQGSTNGWTYEGYNAAGVYTITSPYNMNLQRGYVIRLNGQAQLRGTETFSISYQRR